MRRAYTTQAHPIIIELFNLLDEQAAMARVAVTVAQAELSADAKRAEGRKAQARGETAATINAAERAKALGAEVVKLRRSNPGLTKTDLARILSERGFGGQHAIKKIIS